MPIPGDTIAKDPDADLPYAVDWSAWLDDGETISVSTWDVSDSGMTQSLDSIDGATTMVWLAGGTVGSKPYRVTNHIETSNGKEDDRSFFVWIKER